MFTISNKAYDILKAIATIVLPAISTLYLAIAGIWGLGFAEQVNATIVAIICFIDTLLGLFLKQSSKEYAKSHVKDKKKK